MPRIVEKHTVVQNLTVSEERFKALLSWLTLEVDDALISRKPLETIWQNCLLRYDGVPRLEVRDVPIQNAPNIEITIGAIASDMIYAQALDLIFGASPLVTVRPKPKYRELDTVVDMAKALQVFLNHLGSSPEVDLRNAVEDALLDDIQLGTAVLYIPWVSKHKKTKVSKELSFGPRIRSAAVEDILVPGGTQRTIDEMPFFGLSLYYTQQELNDVAKANKWDISGFRPLGGPSWMRSRRETLARHNEGMEYKGQMYEVILAFCYYDIDGDGLDEDLFIIYNHEGRSIAAYSFNAMDCRPVEKMVYQRRAHMFYGLGVIEMIDPFEEELTDLHNFSTLNILLANSRVWAGDGTVDDDLKVWPGKVITGLANKDSLRPLQMADIYTSIWQAQLAVMQLANQRVGISDAVSPTNIPDRAPGITTMSVLQQVNKRFTPAFDGMKLCISRALTQCLYRYKERLLIGDNNAKLAIMQVLGYEDGNLVIDLLSRDSFDEFVDVELTATSASTNREADRQNALMLSNLLIQYYQRTLELVTIASNPQTPPEVRETATRIANAAGEIIDRTIRTFDQIRDPSTFVLEVDDTLKSLEASGGSDQMALQQLVGALVSGGGQQKQPGGIQ